MPNKDGIILARWQTFLETVPCSPLEFYAMVEDLLVDSELPDISFSEVRRNEKGWFSPKRVYLRIRYRQLYFDVSAFVAGNALVIGWWLHQDSPGLSDLLAEIPGIRFFLERTIHHSTYYQVDYVEYFQHHIHALILQAVDELRNENGLPLLLNEVRIPIWEDVW